MTCLTLHAVTRQWHSGAPGRDRSHRCVQRSHRRAHYCSPRSTHRVHRCSDGQRHYDPSRIAQVFSNLISNAVRHGNSQLPIYASLKVDNGTARFCVHNYGKPIPPHALTVLFSPEGRYSRYSTGERGASAGPGLGLGLGLGLFIAAQIVESHGGQIEVVSTLEGGTIFHVTLPGCL